jgi:hypothetical protein
LNIDHPDWETSCLHHAQASRAYYYMVAQARAEQARLCEDANDLPSRTRWTACTANALHDRRASLDSSCEWRRVPQVSRALPLLIGLG